MTTTNQVFGIPVEGEPDHGYQRKSVEQKPLSELEPLLRAVLEHEEVGAIRWNQYTPYFDDGNPCVFSLGEVFVRIGEYSEEYDEDFDDWDYRGGFQDSWDLKNSEVNPALVRAVTNLSENFDHFELALKEVFGDHAEITVTKEKIILESCDHD